MNIVRWDPFRTFMGLTDSALPAPLDAADGQTRWVPAIDVFEKDESLVIRAEVPGVKREDIEVRVENGVLALSGERKRETEAEEKNAYRMERVHGSFSRRFRLSDSFDATKVDATYENGVLELRVPRSEKSRSRTVEIKVA